DRPVEVVCRDEPLHEDESCLLADPTASFVPFGDERIRPSSPTDPRLFEACYHDIDLTVHAAGKLHRSSSLLRKGLRREARSWPQQNSLERIGRRFIQD